VPWNHSDTSKYIQSFDDIESRRVLISVLSNENYIIKVIAQLRIITFLLRLSDSTGKSPSNKKYSRTKMGGKKAQKYDSSSLRGHGINSSQYDFKTLLKNIQ
jgi:hypothetical protein